jgi:hypothetical protein
MTVFALANVQCATIIHGSSQHVSISSSPTNATVNVDGRVVGQTPIITELERDDKHLIEISLDGYELYQIALSRDVSGWIAGNIIFGGFVGLAVDAITGAMYKLDPEHVHADLKAVHSQASLPDGQLYIAVVLSPDPDWTRVGTLKTR